MSPLPGFADAFALDGQVAVVTGAGSGIGAASAQAARPSGRDRHLCRPQRRRREGHGRRDRRGGRRRPPRCEIDITDRDAVFELASEVAAQHDRLDIWCNIAGIINQVLVADMTDEQFDAVFDVNFRGAMYGCQAAVAGDDPGRPWIHYQHVVICHRRARQPGSPRTPSASRRWRN